MSAVAVMLIAMGITDGCRRMFRSYWLPVLLGPLVVVAVAALSALWHPGGVVLLVTAALATIAWEWLCIRSERSGERETAPLGLFAVPLTVLMVLSGWASRVSGLVARWCTWTARPLHHVDPTKVLMVVAAVLLQLVTGNQLVRLVLGSVGAVKPAGQPPEGPHERQYRHRRRDGVLPAGQFRQLAGGGGAAYALVFTH